MMTEQKREYMKAYREKNREKIRAQRKAYHEKNREKNSEKVKAFHAAHPLWAVWHDMMQRCGLYKGAPAETLARYAGRGITVCDEWRSSYKPFEEWALANGWEKGLQLDRIDNDKGYSPANCRFVTPRDNSINRCNTILAAGIPLATWFDAYKSKMNELGLTYHVVLNRFTRGWTLEKALFTPIDLSKSHRRSA